MNGIDVLVVGAGFAGSVAARALADRGKRILVLDKRHHIAGNAFDSIDAHGVQIHNYGPHIFHTNSEKVLRWLSRFTTWRFYEHKVLAKVGEKFVPIPVNRTTINELYGLQLDEDGAERYLRANKELRPANANSEDVVLSSVGADLCEKLFRGYTRKQWGLDLSELSAGVAARIPTRTNDDDRYFTDKYQFMPALGFTAMFQNMLDHPNIKVKLGLAFDPKVRKKPALTIYTGPVDEYFGFCFGKLPYRSLRFVHEHVRSVDKLQPTGTLNYPNDYLYTRSTEFKHLTGQTCVGTSLVYEFPTDEGDPYYPIPKPENESLLKRYQNLTEAESGVLFVGRLAEYRYYNMDQVVAASLALVDRIEK